jgi:tetratricopeptide (TPR) repeat protein
VTIRLDPRESVAHYSRGIAWHAKGDFDKALSDFDESIRLYRKSAWAHDRRAWICATCPKKKYRDGAKAIEDATKACELTDWKYPYCLGTLAAAYAEAGQFDKAVEWQKKAIGTLSAADAEAGEFAKAQRQPIRPAVVPYKHYVEAGEFEKAERAPEARKREFQNRLKLYKERKPYRDEPTK